MAGSYVLASYEGIHFTTNDRLFPLHTLALRFRDTAASDTRSRCSIVFIDEVDAIGTKRHDSKSSGEREIHRTLLELLNDLTREMVGEHDSHSSKPNLSPIPFFLTSIEYIPRQYGPAREFDEDGCGGAAGAGSSAATE